MFDEKTIQELKSYVYLLINPDTKTPFYVGKGRGNRVFDHLMDAKDGKVGTDKLDHIQSILKNINLLSILLFVMALMKKQPFKLKLL